MAPGRHLILGQVGATVWQVHQPPERHHLDPDLPGVLLQQFLGGVRLVERPPGGTAAGPAWSRPTMKCVAP